MSSHAHMILELPTAKEVSILWDLNLFVYSSSQDERQRENDSKKESDREKEREKEDLKFKHSPMLGTSRL